MFQINVSLKKCFDQNVTSNVPLRMSHSKCLEKCPVQNVSKYVSQMSYLKCHKKCLTQNVSKKSQSVLASLEPQNFTVSGFLTHLFELRDFRVVQVFSFSIPST